MPRKCKLIDDQAELSGSGHEDDDVDDSENEQDRAFIDDGPVEYTKDDVSPVHSSEEEPDEDDLILIRDHEEAQRREKRKQRKRRIKRESSSDEDSEHKENSTPPDESSRDSMAAFIEKDVESSSDYTSRDSVKSNGRRPLEAMTTFTNFRTPTVEETTRPRSWSFLMPKVAVPVPNVPKPHGYVRVKGELKYRRRDGTTIAATGVDVPH